MCQCWCGRKRLHEACPFLGRRRPPSIEASGILEHAVSTGRTDGDDVVIEHHERQPAVAFQGMAVMEVEDGLLLPGLQPIVAGHLSVVLVDLAIAFFPVVELAGPRESQPRNLRAGSSARSVQ